MNQFTRSSKLVAACALAAFLLACSSVPITGRQQLNLMPDAAVLSMSFKEYDQFLSEHRISQDAAATRTVKEVGGRIAEAVNRYFTEKNQAEVLSGYAWDFNLVDDTEVNAWCMPGGKVVVYTGILPVTKDANGLAVVMGHEIAHAVAKHGNERMSEQMLVSLGAVALDQALQNKSERTREMWNLAYGAGSQVGYLLPYSRTHETEADRLGLIFMAMAGYDPNAAIPFWERMAAKSGGGAPPEFLSTHPADATRIENIRKNLPEAMPYYRAAGR